MPPNLKKIIYGACLWGLKFPIAIADIEPTFRQARKIFDESGFLGQCSVELFAASEPIPTADIHYAAAVREASQENNFVPITMIFRPKPSPSMVSSSRKKRKEAVEQCGRSIELAVIATPQQHPVIVNGPFQLVHGAGKIETITPTRKKYLVDSLKHVAEKLEEKARAYGALEPLRRSETKMPSQADFWLDVLDRVKSPRLGLLVDTVHFYEGNGGSEEMLKALEMVCQARKCFGVHLSNYPSRVEWEPSGIAKYTPEILRILKEHKCKVPVDYEGFDKCLDKLVGLQRNPNQKNQTEVFARSMRYLASHVKQ